MKMTWKKNVGDSKNKTRKRPISFNPNLPFEDLNSSSDTNTTAESLKEGEVLGNEDEGKYREALGKWESAITLMPERAILHEQKAQVLLELGEAWNALKAATRMGDAWKSPVKTMENLIAPLKVLTKHWLLSVLTCLCYNSVYVFLLKSCSPQPDSVEAKDDRETASHLLKRRKQLHSRGLSSTENRFLV
ncbi:UNVERIFIED_CONTAM: Tetratricopeptide repeat protein 33 [Sesamum calycinum]|uniref:Tetratricopeptide repeat protein 33 n=1 Tax=Sesamum calycinum TaxID=2727403 RepID=A0AAW2P924_9LAMI